LFSLVVVTCFIHDFGLILFQKKMTEKEETLNCVAFYFFKI